MTNRTILVTGGTGTLGRPVVAHLRATGAHVRALSRGRRSTGDGHHVTGDVRTGDGLDDAVAGVDTIVHCVDPVPHVIGAARRTGTTPHLVSLSIVGVDRVPLAYYRRKLADEHLIAESGLGWTVLRTTQFHDLVAVALRMLAKPPVLMVPAGFSFQPIEVREVGARLAALALAGPAGRVPDLAGPQARTVDDLAWTYLAARGQRRPIVPVPLPGPVCRAYRTGGHLAPEHAEGTVSFEQYRAG